jgi:hypothetical protein
VAAAIRGDFRALFDLEMTAELNSRASSLARKFVVETRRMAFQGETYCLYAASLPINGLISSQSFGGSRSPFGGNRLEPNPFCRNRLHVDGWIPARVAGPVARGQR